MVDPLTHLPNRLYFIDRLESAIETARQQGKLFAVLFVDLDQFKLVNDSLGHAAGDELLLDVAGRLRASIRSISRRDGSGESVVARIGGDEFAIFLGHIRCEADASTAAMRILERLGEPFQFEGRRMFVSASIGIALSSTGDTPEELLHNADTAMYHAKASGKARYVVFDRKMHEQVVARLEMELIFVSLWSAKSCCCTISPSCRFPPGRCDRRGRVPASGLPRPDRRPQHRC